MHVRISSILSPIKLQLLEFFLFPFYEKCIKWREDRRSVGYTEGNIMCHIFIAYPLNTFMVPWKTATFNFLFSNCVWFPYCYILTDNLLFAFSPSLGGLNYGLPLIFCRSVASPFDIPNLVSSVHLLTHVIWYE